MELNDFANRSPWLITADKLELMFHHLPANAEEAASIFSLVDEESTNFSIRDGVAVIPVVGPMFKRASFFSRFFGDRSMTGMARSIRSAADNQEVKAIVLDIDSPGGTVSGTEAFGNAIFGVRGKKPIVSFANGCMCSAAYWSGSGADKVVAEKSAVVGSIGVVLVHYEVSELYKKWGIKPTVITAGQYKAIGNDVEPLSEKARSVIQGQLDTIYGLFVDTVARNRNCSREKALAMADGKLFIGEQAVEEGLVDSVGSIENAIEMALEMAANNNRNFTSKKEAKKVMDLKTLKAEHPDLVDQIQNEVRADSATTISTLQSECADLKVLNVNLKSANESLEKEVKDLGMKNAALQADASENARKSAEDTAKATWAENLGNSNIPEEHHARVKRGVDFDAYYKDGVFDKDAHTKAVEAEVKEWNGIFASKGTVDGFGSSHRRAAGDLDAGGEDDLVDEMFGMAGGIEGE